MQPGLPLPASGDYQAKNGGTWRALPHDFPPWAAVWQQKKGPLARLVSLAKTRAPH
jgi:transposase